MSTTLEPQPQRGLQRLRKTRFHELTGVQILASGAYAPANVVQNADLATLGYDADWIVQRTGIQERRRADSPEATSDLAYEAARACLANAQVEIDEVDLILVATCTPDSLMPSTACRLQQRLGSSAAAMDLNAACSGFVYALSTAAQFVKSGCCRHVLVVGAEVMTRSVNPDDKKTYPLFGDGAGAALVGVGSPEQGLVSYTLGADGEGGDLLCIPAGGSREPFSEATLGEGRQFMRMNGRPVFKWAVRTVSESIRDTLEFGGLTTSDLKAVVLHQANLRIVDAVFDELDIAPDRAVVNLERYGNTSAASIPIALHEAEQDGRINRGDLVLMCGFGAGLTWGTAIVRW